MNVQMDIYLIKIYLLIILLVKKGRIRVVASPTSSTTENVYVLNNMNADGAFGMGGFKTSALCLCLV
jgi:hypothetical protein